MCKLFFCIISSVLCGSLYAQPAGVDMIKYKTSETIKDFDYENELKEVAVSSRVVGMGEATHGSTEFELLKTEIVKTLITRYGYRHLVLESGVAPCAAINEYISTGRGELKRMMMYLPWPYTTEGFVDMLTWLKEYNAGKAAKDQVQFYGLDVQCAHPNEMMRMELRKSGHITGVKDTMLLHQLELVKGAEKEKHKALQQLYDDYAKRQYSSRLDSIIAINVIETQICNNISHGGSRYAFREDMLYKYAHMVIDVLPADQKILIWAHNGHVSKRHSARKSMGSMLHDTYGDAYKSIGFEYYKGDFRANTQDVATGKSKLTVYNDIAGNPDALGAILHPVNKGILGIDVAANKGNPLVDKKQLINSIGAEYNYNSAKDAEFYTEKLVLERSFNYLLVADDVHPNIDIYRKQ